MQIIASVITFLVSALTSKIRSLTPPKVTREFPQTAYYRLNYIIFQSLLTPCGSYSLVLHLLNYSVTIPEQLFKKYLVHKCKHQNIPCLFLVHTIDTINQMYQKSIIGTIPE